MRITFDPSFDHGYWPGPLAERDAVTDELWVGEAGLLGALETSLGLGGASASNGERAAGLLGAVSAPEGFWARSAEADALGTARRLLMLRDELVFAGWNGEPLTARLGQLAKVTEEVRPGIADRVAAVVAALERRAAHVERLDLIEPVSDLRSLWTRVFDALARQGTEVARRTLEPSPTSGDLLAARGDGFDPVADGSIQLLRPYGNLAAADEVAAWLAAHDDPGRMLTVGPSAVLDAALHRHGLPATGAYADDGGNALVSLIPLVLSMGWEPPDPEQVMALLSLQMSPIPPGIARRLRYALSEWPAVASPLWDTKLEEGLAAIDDDTRRKATSERVARIFKPVGPRGGGYPVADVRARLDDLSGWLRRRLATLDTGSSPVGAAPWKQAMGACQRLERLVTESGLSTLSSPQLRRFIEQIVDGSDAARLHRPHAGLASVGHPGAVVGPVDTVVWWSFRADEEGAVRKLPLMPAEYAALREAGIALREPREVALCRSRRWVRPLLQASRSLVLVAPRGDADSAPPHPLWDEIVARMPSTGHAAKLTGARLHGAGMQRTQRELLRAPGPQVTFHVPAERLAKRERWSPSALGTLLGCSLKWVLDYVGNVRGRGVLPDGSLLYGRIAHQVLAEVFQQFPLTPDAAEQAALAVFEERVPRLAANLFLPGADAPRSEVKQVCARAARDLAKILDEASLEPQAVEEAYKVKALGADLKGIPDLVLGPKPAVVDLKWGGARWRREELENGSAYQLAAYSLLVGGKGKASIPAAYYILTTNQLIPTDADALGGMRVDAVSLQATWDGLGKAFSERWGEQQLGAGVIRADANGLDELQKVEPSALDDGGVLRIQPPCKFCDHEVLCGQAFEVPA